LILPAVRYFHETLLSKTLHWLFRLVAACILIYAVLVLSGYEYVARALVYTTPDIDDYTLFHNRVIKAGKAAPWPVSSRLNTLRLTPADEQFFSNLGTTAIVAIHQDSLLHEQYWDGYSAESISGSFSAAKSIVGLLTGIAVQEGKIKSIDDPVGYYLPEFTSGDKKYITIRHLLTMSSGLDFEEDYTTPFCHTTEAYYGKNLPALIHSLKTKYPAGTIWKYKSGDTQLLQMVLEKATGMKMADYCSVKLWQPIEAEHDALWSMDKENGHEKAYCCFNTTAKDFARIGNLVLHDGYWKNRLVISPAYLHEAFTPNMIRTEQGYNCDFYGFQWWLTQYEGRPVHYARGILGQYIIVVPHRELVIVRLGHARGKKQGVHFEETYKLIDLFTR